MTIHRKPVRSLLTGLSTWALCGAALTGCAGGPVDEDDLDTDEPHVARAEDGKADSSREATFLIFEFDGQLEAGSAWSTDSQIREQMLYTIGHLNHDNSVGRLDNLKLSNVRTERSGSNTVIKYHAVLPVAWGKPRSVPSSYAFTLPRNIDRLGDFTAKYKESCVDWAAHDVDEGSMWYYYRPARSGCTIADADVVKFSASVALSKNITKDKYPEYNKVWEDNELRVVAVFGKYEESGTTASDAGIAAYNEFIAAVRSRLGGEGLTTIPSTIPSGPGIAAKDITFQKALPGGKKVTINALLVDAIASAGPEFFNRYEELSTRADLIAYNGHAGLGQNVRVLSSYGKFVPGQYLIVFMNGCDTYAYVDGSLAQARRAVNPDDQTGTKYMDFVTNAMPAYFHEDSEASMALINGLLAYDAPKQYGQMFDQIDTSQVVLVTGEEDNVFQPGTPTPTGWSLDELGTIAKGASKKWKSTTLAAGTYVVKLDGTGDADLYVRKGADPTTRTYDCRPYEDGSDERCEISLSQATTLHIMVRGYAASSDFHLTAKKK
jgi:hypothetical protein